METKNNLFVIIFCLGTLIAFAQSDSMQNDKKVEKIKKWEVGVNINTVEPITDAGFDNNTLNMRAFVFGNRQDKSFCLGINGSYIIKGKLAIRLAGKITDYHIIETFDNRSFSNPSSDYELDTMDAKQSLYTFSSGIFWNGWVKKLNFYGGFQFRYQKFGPLTGNLDVTISSYSNSILTYHRNYYTHQEGGYSFGVGPFIGFSVNVFKNISVGSEFSSSYSYYKTGGEITQEVVDVLNNQNVGTIISLQTYKGFKFSSILCSINMAVNL